MKPSPQGRLPKAPRVPSSPASTIAMPALEAEPQVAAVAAGDPRLGAAVEQRATTAQPRRRISSRSPVISRASISSVTPGRVPIRTPASLAALRAAVWESDWIVGASTTSAAAIAAATGARRLGGVRVALGDHRQRRVGAVALRLDPHQRADLFGHRIADHQHLLARRDAHALADHRPHRPVQLRAHRATLARSMPDPLQRRSPTATLTMSLNRRRAGAASPTPRTRSARPAASRRR